MRNGNEEIRNGNEEIRLSMEKLVHASQKLAHCIDFFSRKIMAELIHCKSYCPYDRFETEVIYLGSED